MSTLTVQNIQGSASSSNTISVASGHKISGAAGSIIAPGMVLQTIQGSSTTSTSQTSTTWTDTTLSASITPSSTSSKILILVNQSYRMQRSTYYGGASIKLLRGSTFIYYAAENTTPYYPYLEIGGVSGINVYDYFNLNYLDSPSTTSATTYKTQQRSYGGAEIINTQQGGAKSTITLQEIAG